MRQSIGERHAVRIDLGGGIVREIIFIPEESRFVERVFDVNEELRLTIMQEIEEMSKGPEKELRAAIDQKFGVWAKIKAWIKRFKRVQKNGQ